MGQIARQRAFRAGCIRAMSDEQWFAIAVRANRERAVERLLASKNYQVFLPLYRNRRVWSDRVKELESPLFSGYVFARFDIADRTAPVVSTAGVIRIIGVGGKPVAVEEREIRFIRTLVESGLAVEPWSQFHPGSAVRITYGALTGVEGTLVEVKKHHHLVVSVTLLQRSVAVEIDSSWAQPIGPRYSSTRSSIALPAGRRLHDGRGRLLCSNARLVP